MVRTHRQVHDDDRVLEKQEFRFHSFQEVLLLLVSKNTCHSFLSQGVYVSQEVYSSFGFKGSKMNHVNSNNETKNDITKVEDFSKQTELLEIIRKSLQLLLCHF